MYSKDGLVTWLKLLVLLVVIAVLLVLFRRSETAQEAQDAERILPVQVHQMAPPQPRLVALRCDGAVVKVREIKDLTCYLKNNTSKYIVAGSLDVTVTLEGTGRTNQQGSLLSFDTFLHPDFRAEHPQNLIAPGAEYRIQDMSTIFDDPVANIIAGIDYVEFDDGTKIGPDHGGSQVVKSQREGARKYKDWLAAKYKETGSLSTIVTLLAEDVSLPPELNLFDSDEARGAKILRTQERQLYETKGAEALLKHLKSTDNLR